MKYSPDFNRMLSTAASFMYVHVCSRSQAAKPAWVPSVAFALLVPACPCTVALLKADMKIISIPQSLCRLMHLGIEQ